MSSDLLETGELTDVTLAAGSKVFSVHKFVLSIASPFFRQLFRILDSEKTVVFLKDVDPTVLEILIQFIYKGEVHTPQGDLTNLLETARSLEVQGFNSIKETKSRYGAKRQIESNANNSKVLPKDIFSYTMITKKPHILKYHCNDIKSESVGTLKCSLKS